MIYFTFFIVILLLIILSGFIAGSETAITGASRAHLYHLSKKGDVRAKKALTLQENMANALSTILVVNQMVVYIISTASTLFAMNYLSGAGVALLPTVVGVLIAIYSEIFPKMVAIRFTSKFALLVAPVLSVTVKILRPLISILEACARYTLKIFNINENDSEKSMQSDEELRGAIEMHSSQNNQDEAQKKIMLKSILDLGAITVNHTMVHRKHLFTLDASLPVEKIVSELTHCPFSRVPLWRDNPENIIGILKTKTFFRALQINVDQIDKINVNNLISPPWFIPETTHLLDQLQSFRTKREHFALVVDEYGDLMGCITLEDILEEIVGEIVDEYDTISSGINVQADGSVIADGATPVRDLNRQFDWNLPEEEAATIAGYVMHEVRKIPDIGQTYLLSNFKIEILRRQKNQIMLVKITNLSPSAKDDEQA